MKASTIPTIIIFLTVLLGLLVFALSDHSGLSVNDCTLEKNSQENVYNLNYNLLVGRHFNLLECHYILYTEDDRIIANGTTTKKNINMGSFPINEKIPVENSDITPKKAEITVYTQIVKEENGVNKTSMEKSVNKTFKLE